MNNLMQKNYIEFEEIDSTNDYLKANYQRLSHLTVVRAKYQTKGRGQFDRSWESDKDKNLLISLLLKDYIPTSNDINLMVVSAIIATMQAFGVDGARFKYPNDVYLDDFKLAGMLIESKYNGTNPEYMIIGIGVNINQENFASPTARSLKSIVKKDIDIADFAKILLANLTKTLGL